MKLLIRSYFFIESSRRQILPGKYKPENLWGKNDPDQQKDHLTSAMFKALKQNLVGL